MKRTASLLILSFLVSLFAFWIPKPVFAASPYGLEGGVGTSSVMGINILNLLIMGACAEGEAPAPPDENQPYWLPDLPKFMGEYSADGCPEKASYGHSALAGLNNTVIAFYNNPPATTQMFAMDLGQTLGFIPRQVNAQGIGFAGLSVLLPIWKAFRNVAYAMLAVILIVIGFMVMFRKKIDPKTVVTVQNAIPRVVVALLLVTFSYAIVGLMIDLMYFVIVLTAGLLTNVVPGGSFGALVSGIETRWYPNLLDPSTWLPTFSNAKASAPEVISVLLNGGLGGLLRFFFGSGFQAFDDIGKLLTGNWNPAFKTAVFAVQGILTYLIGGGGTKGAVIGALTSGPVLLLLIILIVLLFGIIRLVFMLVDAYINIIISLLFSPFQLMLEAVPGTNAFGNWFRWLFAKIITFPITAALLMVAAFLTSQDNATKMWAPPLISSGGGTTGMAGFIGLGMLLVIPSIVASIQKGLKAEPFIPGGVGAVLGPIGSGVGQLFQLGYQYSFISSALRHKPDNRSPVQTLREGAQKGFGAITGQGEGH